MDKRAQEVLDRLILERGKAVMQPWRVHLAERDPEFLEMWQNLISYALVKERALPRKYKEIIAIVMDALTGYNEGLKIHTQGALEHGAKEAEILEALELASCLGLHYLSIPMTGFVEGVEAFRASKEQ